MTAVAGGLRHIEVAALAWYTATIAPAPMIWTLVSSKFEMRTVLIPGALAVLSDSS